MRFRYPTRMKRLLVAMPLASRRMVGIAVVVAALLSGLWLFASFYFKRSPVTDGLKVMVSAFEGRRPLEARLSGLKYAPFISVRGGSDHADPVSRDLAEKLLLEAVSEKPTAASRQALGQFYLMSGSPAKAIVQFEQALKDDSNSSSLHNDFGVALLEMSESLAPDSNNILHYVARSFEQIELGLRLNPANVEALHNRALLLDRMKLPQQRNRAWQSYLAKETDPAWTAEAKRKVEIFAQTEPEQLSQSEILESFVAATRSGDDERAWQELTGNKEMITERFIPQELAKSFLNATANGNREDANKRLDALRYAGRLEKEKAHDPFISEIAEYYARTSPEQQKLLLAAHAYVKRGYADCSNGNYDKTPFVEARKLFLQAGDVWEARICDYWIAYCLSQGGEIAESSKMLNSLAHYSKARQYHWLEGQAVCWIANNHTLLREYSRSLETYEQALAIASKIDDSYNQQKILTQLGNNFLWLGQSERALQYDWRALQLIDRRSNSIRQIWRSYLYTARALISLNLFEAAAQYGEEMLSLALNAARDPGMSHFSYLYLAQINGGKRNFDEAIRFASESLKIADSLPDRENARQLHTGSLRLLAHLQRQSGALEPALATYNQVIENYDKMELSVYKYDAHKGRLLCYAALKDTRNFEAHLPAVLDEFEQLRLKIFEEQNKNTFFDREQNVYDLAINYAFERNDYIAALNYSEQSRARSLLTALTEKKSEDKQGSWAPLNAVEMQRQLPPNLQVLQFAILEDKLVVWLITNSSIQSRAINVKANDLRALVSEYVKEISSGPGQTEKLRPLSHRLYETLLGPFITDLDPQKILCIIPDKALSYLPFAALISPVTQQYLVKEFVLLSAPSLNVLLRCTSAAKNHSNGNPETLLSIGNPSFDRQAYPELDDLPAASREAVGIASHYPRSYKLIGPDAVKTAIEKRLPTANVVHFAGHYVTNPSQPLQSKLLLAKQEGAAADDLTVDELMDMKLPRAKLVVLSACETSGTDYYNGEGLVGIARTFLKTGIPLVVASQWSVESESTAELMLKLHRYRKLPGMSTVLALRKAQLELLDDPKGLYTDPYYWAAFTTVGGYADF